MNTGHRGLVGDPVQPRARPGGARRHKMPDSAVWDHFGTVFSYVKLFGLMHRIYRSTATVNASRTRTKPRLRGRTGRPGIAILKVAEVRDSHGGELPAGIALCDRWRWLVRSSSTRRPARPDSSRSTPRRISIHTTARATSSIATSSGRSPIKWERANTDWKLVREDDVFDLGAEVMIPDFAIEHPDGRRAILEIVGFWTPEYLDARKLEKIRKVEADNFVLAVSGATGLCERGVRERRRSSAVVQNGNSRLRCSRFG